MSHNLPFDPHLPRTVAIYARVSCARGSHRALSRQFARIFEQFLESRYPWQIAGMYGDYHAGSHGNQERAGMFRLQAEILDGTNKASVILVDSLDRLGRSSDLSNLIRELANCGIIVVTVDDLPPGLHRQTT